MKTNALLCALLATVGLAACGTMGTSGTPGSGGTTGTMAISPKDDCGNTINPRDDFCSGNVCTIAVEVVIGTDGKCEVLVGIPTLKVFKGNNDVILHWWLAQGSNFEFRSESGDYTVPIIFKDQSDPYVKDQFSPSYVMAGSKAVRITDKNTYGGSAHPFGYKVKVYKKGTNDSLTSKDPAIVNDF